MNLTTILIWICILGMIACSGYEFYHVAAECGYHGIEGFRFSYWFFFQDGRSRVNEIMSSNCNLYENWQDAARALYERKEDYLCKHTLQEVFWSDV